MVTRAQSRDHTIVTGGSSGIGAAVVRRLLERGHAVTILDLQQPLAASEAGFASVDITDEGSVTAAVDAAEHSAGPVTGLVTCHGIRGAFVPALDLELDRVRRLFDVHVVGTLAVAREVVGRLDARPASVVTVSSTTAYGGWQKQADYGVAKAAVMQLTKNLAIEWAPLGVRVNSVAPGHTLTPMVQDMIDNGYDVTATADRTPLGRLADPNEIAGTIEFLLCDATFTTGQCVAVDGGWTTVGK